MPEIRHPFKNVMVLPLSFGMTDHHIPWIPAFAGTKLETPCELGGTQRIGGVVEARPWT